MKIERLNKTGYSWALLKIVSEEDYHMLVALLQYLINVFGDTVEVPNEVFIIPIKKKNKFNITYEFTSQSAEELKEWMIKSKYGEKTRKGRYRFTKKLWDVFEVLVQANVQYESQIQATIKYY